MAGRITDVEGDPKNPKTFYVTGATGGVWKTINAGTTFIPLWDHMPIASIGDIAIAPSDPKITLRRHGRRQLAQQRRARVGRVQVDRRRRHLAVGRSREDAARRTHRHSSDESEHRVRRRGRRDVGVEPRARPVQDDRRRKDLAAESSSSATRPGFIDVAMDPRDPNTLYAASWERVARSVLPEERRPRLGALEDDRRRQDAGARSRAADFPETNKGRMNIQIAPSNPNTVYVMVEADSVRGAKPQRLLSGLYRSTDAGKTWTWMSTIDNRPFYFSQIRVDPKNPNRIYRMAVDFQFSDDGGYSWRTGMLGNHEDYHGMWIDPNDPEHFIIGGDAGIFQTWDRGGTYDSMNNMAMGQFYVVSYDYQVPYRVCGGLQDNGSSCGCEPATQRPAADDRLVRRVRRRRAVHGAGSARPEHRLLRVAGRQHLASQRGDGRDGQHQGRAR